MFNVKFLAMHKVLTYAGTITCFTSVPCDALLSKARGLSSRTDALTILCHDTSATLCIMKFHLSVKHRSIR